MRHCCSTAVRDQALILAARPHPTWMGFMIPIRFLMLSRLMSSAWTVGAIALVTALLLEWGLIVADTAGVS